MLPVILWTLGALNGALAVTVSTCPNGEADSLAGIGVTILLYLASAVFVSIFRYRRSTLALALPAAALAVWQSWFAVKLAAGYWLRHEAACNAMGLTSYPSGLGMDGREAAFSIVWSLAIIVFWLGLGVAVWRSRGVVDVGDLNSTGAQAVVKLDKE